MDTLRGKVAVVTGAASGLGEAMARRFAADGAQVVLADVAPLDALAGELGALAVPTDVASAAAVDALAAAAIGAFGRIDVAVSNAGVLAHGPIWEIAEGDWQRVLGVNLMGVLHGIRSFVPHLIASGGHLVNTASMAGVTTLPDIGPYVVSKHGVVAASEVLVADLAKAGHDVGVSVLCPGYVPSRLGLPAGMDVPAVAPDGISAADVAGAVVDAILSRRQWIFTHEGSTDRVRQRVDGIVA